MKSVFTRMQFFSTFLDTLKAFCNFIKVETYRDALEKLVLAAGWPALAATVFKFRASFAKWRWNTLCVCVKALSSIRDLRRAWNPTWFKDSQAADQVKKMAKACADDVFWNQLDLCLPLCIMIEEARVWGSGCACHEAEARQGQKVDCVLKGVRLPDAWGRVQEFAAACQAKVGELSLASDLLRVVSNK